MTITVLCPSCGKQLRAPDSAAGRQAQCPGCGQVIEMPAPDGEGEESQQIVVQGFEESDSPIGISFAVICPSCSKRLQVPAAAAGKEVKCSG